MNQRLQTVLVARLRIHNYDVIIGAAAATLPVRRCQTIGADGFEKKNRKKAIDAAKVCRSFRRLPDLPFIAEEKKNHCPAKQIMAGLPSVANQRVCTSTGMTFGAAYKILFIALRHTRE